MPMLGFGYLITLVGPTQDQPTAHTIFEIVRSVLLSTQVGELHMTKAEMYLMQGFGDKSTLLFFEC